MSFLQRFSYFCCVLMHWVYVCCRGKIIKCWRAKVQLNKSCGSLSLPLMFFYKPGIRVYISQKFLRLHSLCTHYVCLHLVSHLSVGRAQGPDALGLTTSTGTSNTHLAKQKWFTKHVIQNVKLFILCLS